MPRRPVLTIALAASLVLGVVTAGCGSSDKPVTTAASATLKAPTDAKRGGTLTVLMANDVDSVDPGVTYYTPGYMLQYAINRPLYYFEPSDVDTPHPDLAAGPPKVSPDGKTVTIKIKRGIHYAPPVNREVVADDVKYALERGFSGNVGNGYAGLYFSSIKGAPSEPTDGVKDISGIETPDDHTIVLKLTKPYAASVIGALTLPLSVPVPRSYAAPFDKQNPSTYKQHLAFTGPYMIPHDASGKLTGYKPNRSIVVVRNPNWNAKTDDRPAYADKIVFAEGNDPDVASRRILAGSKLVNGDFSPTPAIIQRALHSAPDQISVSPSASFRAVSLNTTLKPFDDINVRKAVVAAFDRNALLLSRGGSVQGTPAWGYLMPGIPGFSESGGATPPKKFDYLQKFDGDLALAKSYMRKAGYPSGLYTGSAQPLEVGIQGGLPQRAAEIAQAQLAKLGIHVKLRLTTERRVPDEVLRRAEGEGRGLPVDVVGEGLPRWPDAVAADVRRRRDLAVLQRQRLDAGRPPGQPCDRRRRRHPARSGPRHRVGQGQRSCHRSGAGGAVPVGQGAQHRIARRRRCREPEHDRIRPQLYICAVTHTPSTGAQLR